MGDSPASDDVDYKEENLLRTGKPHILVSRILVRALDVLSAYQRAAHIITKTTSDGQILYPARGDDSDSFRGFTIELVRTVLPAFFFALLSTASHLFTLVTSHRMELGIKECNSTSSVGEQI